MTTTAKARKAAKRPLVKIPAGPVFWTCERCGARNDETLTLCEQCMRTETFKSWKTRLGERADLRGVDIERLREEYDALKDVDEAIAWLGLTRFDAPAAAVPETQAEASAKESAAGGEPFLPGVEVNEHGVVVSGATSVVVRLPKGLKFRATIEVAHVRAFEWWIGWRFEDGSTAATSAPTCERNGEFASEAAAIRNGFDRAEVWIRAEGRSEGQATRAAKAIVALHQHRDELLGAKAAAEEFLQETPKRAGKKSAGDGIAAPSAAPAPRRSLAAIVDAAAMTRVAVDRIVACPDNNRRQFDQAALDELAASIRQHGVLEPLLVVKSGNVAGGLAYELIAGERRWRAAQQAGIADVPVRILDVTPAEAAELRLVENLKRADLSAIEEALGYQQLLEAGGLSQRQLSERIGVPQSTIANHLRLLKLPEAWRAKVIARAISEPHARELVQYADHPRVFDALDAAIAAEAQDEQVPWHDAVPRLADWPHAIRHAIQRAGRECDPGAYYSYQSAKGWKSGRVLFSEADLERWGGPDDLDIVKVRWPHQKQAKPERYALNVRRWEELHGNLEAAAKTAESKKAAKKAAQLNDQATTAPTAAERRAAQKQRAELAAKKLWRYRTAWLQRAIEARLEEGDGERRLRIDGATVLRLLLFYACAERDDRRCGDLPAAFDAAQLKPAKRKSHQYASPTVDVLESLKGRKDSQVFDVALEALRRWIAQPFEGNRPMHSPRDIEAIAGLLGIDLARDWKTEREYLELWTKDELLDIAAQGTPSKCASVQQCSMKRGELIDDLLQAGLPKKCPPELMKAKEVTL